VFTARYFLPTQCIYVFCLDPRTNSDYFVILYCVNWLVFRRVRKFAKHDY
jgi:hypothetical protein